MRVNVESVHFTADQKLVDYIQKKMDKLDQFFDRILDSRVVLKLENSGRIKDKIAEISVNVPGNTLFCKEEAKTFEAAIDQAQGILRRQLIKYKEIKFKRPV